MGSPGRFLGCVLGAPRGVLRVPWVGFWGVVVNFWGVQGGFYLLQGLDSLLEQSVLGAEPLGSGKKWGEMSPQVGGECPQGVTEPGDMGGTWGGVALGTG